MKLVQIILAACLTGFVSLSFPALAQNKRDSRVAKAEKIKNRVNAKQYTFVAQRALPMKGGGRDLTSEYDLKVSEDTVVAFLPYFGRAYSAPTDPAKGGIKFTSTQFKYQSENTKRGGWSVKITPRDNREVQSLTLIISSEGYASLQVTSTNRQPISFNGYIKADEP